MNMLSKLHPLMPEIVVNHARRSSTRTTVVGRSVRGGHALVSFDDEEKARRWMESHPNHAVVFYLQTITEEEIEF